MLTHIKKWLGSPIFPGDEEKTAQARTMNTLGQYFVLVLVIATVIYVPFFVKHKLESWAVILALLVLYLISRTFMFRGKVAFAGMFLGASGWILFAGLASISGGITSPMMFALTGTTIAVGLLFRPRIGAVFLVLSILSGLGLATLQQSGVVLPQIYIHSPLATWFLFALSLVFTYWTMNLSVRKLENALGLARQQNERREKAEAVLRESEAKFRAVVENGNEGILFCDANARISYRSPSYNRINGYTDEERLGHSVFETVHPDDVNTLHQYWTQVVQYPGMPLTAEYRIRHKDGTWRWVESTSQNLLDNPDVREIITTSRDVTERKRAEDAILRRNAELTILNQIGQALSKLNEPSHILELIFTEIGKVLDNRNLFIALYDQASQYISFPVYAINGERTDGGGRSLGNGITDYIIRTNTPLLIKQDMEETLRLHGIDLIGKLSCSLIAVPMRAEDKVIGVIALQDYDQENVYDEHHIELLTTVASQAAIALENARLYSDVQQKLEERKRAEQALVDSEERFRSFIEQSTDGVVLTDEKGMFIEWNHAQAEITGIPREKAIGMPSWELQFQFLLPERRLNRSSESFKEMMQSAFSKGISSQFDRAVEFEIQAANGERRTIIQTSFPIKTEMGYRIGGIARDVTERKQAEDVQRRLNRELRAISSCNQILVRAEDEQTLLHDICRIVCDEAGYRMAWVGYAEYDETKAVRPVAWAGTEAGYLATANITWDDSERGLGPTGTAIRSGESACTQDYATDPRVGLWRESAQQRGYRSSIALPLKDETASVFGTLTIYSSEPDAFTADEIRLLEELAGDLAFGITTLRARTERKQREQEMQAIATLSAAMRTAPTRAEMLPVIVQQIVNLLGCDSVTIEIIDAQNGDAVVEAGHGLWEALVGTRQGEGTGINAIIAATHRPYHTHNLREDTNLTYPEWAQDGIRGCAGVPLIAQGNLIGFIWAGRNTGIAESEVRLLSAIGDIAANAIYRATLHEQTEKDATDLTLAYDTTLEGWARALELRDQETEGHTRRVVQEVLELAQVMGMSGKKLEDVRRGALLHDIGKMGIPDSVLLKPGSLNEREWEIMRRHPEYAYKLLNQIEYLRPALDIPYCHHEKWDGTGYPRNLKYEEIPLEARIFAIVDVWDALTSDRPYRLAWSKEDAIKYIHQQSGKHFDPAVVEAFFGLAKAIRE